MDLHWLKPLLGRTSPFTTVFLDATRAESAGESEAADRWRAARRTLERDGAPARVLDEIADLVTVPTGASPAYTVIPARGMARSTASRPRSVRRGPAVFSARSTSRPQKAGLSQPTAQPERPCTGVMSRERSCPCSG